MPDFISAIIFAFGNITAQVGWWLIPLSVAVSYFVHKNIVLRVCLASFLLCFIGYTATTLHILYISFMESAAIRLFFTTPFSGIFSFWLYPTDDITTLQFAVSASFYLYIAALLTIGSPVRQYEWARLRMLLTRGPGTVRQERVMVTAPPAPPPAVRAPAARTAPAPPAPMATVEEDDEEREIALASRRVEQSERLLREAPRVEPTPAPPVEEGPSWWQRQRERREVERARREMERAEREAARREAAPPHPAYAGYPYPPPYAYAPPKRPLSEWFRTAYWGTRIVILLIVTFWLVSATGTVLGMLGAFLPAPLRELFADMLNQASEVVRQNPPNR